jgi:uncharacterized protein (TIGR02722 family)
VASIAATSALACGPTAVRGSETPGLDDAAMSTKLDRRDLEDMLAKNLDSLQTSAAVKRWEGEDQPTVAVLAIKNETSEHIDSALNALITKVETALVNGGHVTVISAQDQPELIEKVRAQNSDAFDQSQISDWGKQIGARYFVTGKVYSTDERDDDGRRVQYFLFMRVLEAETGKLLWQNEQSVTKAIID